MVEVLITNKLNETYQQILIKILSKHYIYRFQKSIHRFEINKYQIYKS